MKIYTKVILAVAATSMLIPVPSALGNAALIRRTVANVPNQQPMQPALATYKPPQPTGEKFQVAPVKMNTTAPASQPDRHPHYR